MAALAGAMGGVVKEEGAPPIPSIAGMPDIAGFEVCVPSTLCSLGHRRASQCKDRADARVRARCRRRTSTISR